jgi:hypothetical protein
MACSRIVPALIITSCLTGCGPKISSGSEDDLGDEESESVGESESETSEDELECRLAIRLDQCCNQPFAATLAEIEADLCVVEWPIDWASLPSEVTLMCVEAQPDWCEVVDCDYAAPASDMVGPDGEGGCRYLCPEDTHLAYRNPGCEIPAVECLGIPPPCADEYCSCAGETIYGCGQVGEPFAHTGPCE